jgi:hypothetical protein
MKATDRCGADELFDFAVAHPDGFTRSDVCSELTCSSRDFDSGVRELRAILGDDEIFLVCWTQGRGEWRYQLVGTYDKSRQWGVWMLAHSEARIESQQWLYKALTRALDGRTTEGRKARMMERAMRHLHEELVAIGEDGRLFGGL